MSLRLLSKRLSALIFRYHLLALWYAYRLKHLRAHFRLRVAQVKENEFQSQPEPDERCIREILSSRKEQAFLEKGIGPLQFSRFIQRPPID